MNCNFLEYCAPYTLGILDEKNRVLFEQHLENGCEFCKKELEMLDATVETLAGMQASEQPSVRVKKNILSRIAHNSMDSSQHETRQVWKNWMPETGNGGLFTLRANEGSWEEIGIEGITVKKLFTDQQRKTVTMLIRMGAGTSYPSHRHGGNEECLVLEGELHVGDELVLHAGDYQCAGDDSIHVRQWTDKGCLLFIVSSTEDMLLE